jgi:hypothetical protein
MPTTKIEPNEARIPFLSDKMSFVTGLDPVGLQNPSSRAYTYLLKGLNVVSSRIRNYGFYCWLLKEYTKRVNSKDPDQQKEFIRRAEYIIALSSVANGVEGVNGRQFALKSLAIDQNEYLLTDGIYNDQGTTANTYWAFPFGVFGQYYLGSMRQIRLIEEVAEEDGKALSIYRTSKSSDNLKTSGESLAEAFAQNISEWKRDLLLKCIDNNLITTTQLSKLFPEFNMFQIPDGTQEQSYLIDLLFGQDDPIVMEEDQMSYYRRNTFLHVLQFSKQNPNNLEEHAFTRMAYLNKGQYKDQKDDTLFGWYYYQFNEYFRLASTSFLNGILHELEGYQSWAYLPEFLDIITDDIIEELSDRYGKSEVTSISGLEKLDFENERVVCDRMLQNEGIDALIDAVELLVKLYQENSNQIKSLLEYVETRHINSDYDVLSFYHLDFPRLSGQTTKDFLKSFLLHHVIYRHQNVAYRKMVGNQSTQKFIIEDNYIRHISNFAPAYTASRVGTVIGFMKDLHLIDQNDSLTTKAHELLKNSSI